jgi:hypothetical protein
MAVDTRDGQPWRYRFIMVPAMLACVVVTGAAVYYYIRGSCGVAECMDQLPWLKKVAVALAVFGIRAKSIERTILRWRKSANSE